MVLCASFTICGGMQAQDFTEVKRMFYAPDLLSGNYTSDGQPLLVAGMAYEYAEADGITLYDAQLSPVKTIRFDFPEVPNYNVVKARSGRTVETASDGGEELRFSEGDYSREEIIEILTDEVEGRRDGGIYTDADGVMWFVASFYSYYSPSQGEVVDRTCPMEGYYLTQDNKVFWYSKRYERKYDGEWHEEQVDKEDYGKKYNEMPQVFDFESYDAGSQSSMSMLLTQTMFNNDDKFEYFYETWEYGPVDTMEYDRDNDDVADSLVISYGTLSTGLELRQEDGTVLWRFDYSQKTGYAPSRPVIFEMSGNRYLAVADGSAGGYAFFAINKSGSSIQKVKSLPGLLRAYPNPARRGETVTMELPEAGTEGAQRNVRITGMDGRTIQSVRVGVGERSVQVPLSRMSAGVYNFTLTENGRVVENSRIVVR